MPSNFSRAKTVTYLGLHISDET